MEETPAKSLAGVCQGQYAEFWLVSPEDKDDLRVRIKGAID